MKIAICISGHVRNFEYYSKFLFDKVIIDEKDSNFDVFISTWTTKDSQTDEKIDLNKIVDIYRPKKMIVEENDSRIFDKYNYLTNGNIASSVFSQLYKVNQAATLLKNYSEVNDLQYDLVLKTRFDVEILPLCEEWGENIPNKIEPKIDFSYFEDNFFYVEEDHGGYKDWYHDKCFISNQKDFLTFSDIYNNLQSLMLECGSSITERLIYRWLHKNGMEIKKTRKLFCNQFSNREKIIKY